MRPADTRRTSAGHAPEEAIPLRHVPFVHGDVRWSIALPADAEALIDEDAFAADERLPYWAELWPSAVALTRWVLDRPTAESLILAERADSGTDAPGAIELGCGVGLVSLALASRGIEVLATDHEPAALCLAAQNVRANLGRDIATALVDWRSPPPLPRSPLIVGADLAYEARNAIALSSCIAALAAPRGRIILADPGRRWMDDLLARLEALGFGHRTLATRPEAGTADNARLGNIRIVELRAPAEAGFTDRGR